MKKVILVAMLVIGISTFAQERKPREGRGEMLTPEQMAEKRVEKMKKDLNLTDKQAQQIRELSLAQAEKMKAYKEERKAKKEEMRNRRMEEAKAMKAEFEKEKAANDEQLKKILTPEQFAKHQQIQAERKEKMHEKREQRMENRKGKRGMAPAPTEE